MSIKTLVALVLVAPVVTACVTVTDKTDDKTGFNVQTVAVRGCGSPSHTVTYIHRPGQADPDKFASSGTDLCNTVVNAAIGAIGNVGAAAVLPEGQGVNNTVISGSSAMAAQQTDVAVSQ